MKGVTSLVLLPALDGTGVFFEPLRRHFPAWLTTRVVSYPPQGPHDYERLCERSMQALDGSDPVHLLGWSFGGPLALMLAERLGGRVRSVTLCSTFVTPPIRALVPLRWGLRGPVVGLARGLWRARFLVPGVGSPAFRAAKAETWAQVSSHALAARGRAIMRVDARDTLRRLPVPVLCLAGSQDRVVDERSLAQLMACRPDAHLEYLMGGHYALYHMADEAALHVARFIAGVGGTERGAASTTVEPVQA